MGARARVESRCRSRDDLDGRTSSHEQLAIASGPGLTRGVAMLDERTTFQNHEENAISEALAANARPKNPARTAVTGELRARTGLSPGGSGGYIMSPPT